MSVKVAILLTNDGERIKGHFDTRSGLFNTFRGTEIWLFAFNSDEM